MSNGPSSLHTPLCCHKNKQIKMLSRQSIIPLKEKKSMRLLVYQQRGHIMELNSIMRLTERNRFVEVSLPGHIFPRGSDGQELQQKKNISSTGPDRHDDVPQLKS